MATSKRNKVERKADGTSGPVRWELIRVESKIVSPYYLESKIVSTYYLGYVTVPPGHPWHGKHYSKINERLGASYPWLTYSDKEGPGWKVGFDTMSSGATEEEAQQELIDLALLAEMKGVLYED